MRNRTLIALAIAATVAVAACSGSSSGLTGKTWQLTEMTGRTAAGLGPLPAAELAKYTIEFKSDGTYQAKADCNQTSGAYTTTSDGGLTIQPGPTTLAACPEGSLSDQYIQSLTKALSYAIVDGELTISVNEGWPIRFE
jgi:heat shock protein HslJ